MYYEVVVTHAGEHYFATAPRSLTTPQQAYGCHDDFLARFPGSEGFAVNLYKVDDALGTLVRSDEVGRHLYTAKSKV